MQNWQAKVHHDCQAVASHASAKALALKTEHIERACGKLESEEVEAPVNLLRKALMPSGSSSSLLGRTAAAGLPFAGALVFSLSWGAASGRDGL